MANVTNRHSVLARNMVANNGSFDQTAGMPSRLSHHAALRAGTHPPGSRRCNAM